MTITIKNNIAIVYSDEVIITDGQSALDFIATVGYDHNVHKIAVNKAAVTEDFSSFPQDLPAISFRNSSITMCNLPSSVIF